MIYIYIYRKTYFPPERNSTDREASPLAKPPQTAISSRDAAALDDALALLSGDIDDAFFVRKLNASTVLHSSMCSSSIPVLSLLLCVVPDGLLPPITYTHSDRMS